MSVLKFLTSSTITGDSIIVSRLLSSSWLVKVFRFTFAQFSVRWNLHSLTFLYSIFHARSRASSNFKYIFINLIYLKYKNNLFFYKLIKNGLKKSTIGVADKRVKQTEHRSIKIYF